MLVIPTEISIPFFLAFDRLNLLLRLFYLLAVFSL